MTELSNPQVSQDSDLLEQSNLQSIQSQYTQTLSEAQQRQKQKLEKQFSLVTPIVFIYVKQMIVLFVLKVVMYQMDDNGLNRNEKVIAYLLIVVYYILYFNSMYKFAMSFVNIMKNSQIDESDIMIMEIYGTVGFGMIYLVYGIIYSTVYLTEHNLYYGNVCCAIAISLFIYCFQLFLNIIYQI